jgi:hypothetical protein
LDFFRGRETLSLVDLQLKKLRLAALALKVKLEEIETQTDRRYGNHENPRRVP